MGKNIKMKISIIMAVLIIFQCSTAFAAETNNIIEFDLQTAIDTVLKNSNSLKLLDEKIKNANDRYYYYCNLAIAASSIPGHVGQDLIDTGKTNDLYLIENKKIELIYPKQKLNDLNKLKYEKLNKIVDLKLNITEKYFTILSVDKQISYQQDLINRLEEALKVKNNDIKFGKSTASSLTDIELNIKIANKSMVQFIRDKEKMVMSLNSLIGKPINEKIKIKEIDIPIVEYDFSNIEKNISDRQQNNATIKDIKYLIEEAKLEVEIVKGNTNREDPIELDALEIAQLSQEYALKDEMANIEKYIRQENNTILNLQDDIKIKSLNNEICQKNLKVAQEKLKVGVMSQSEMNSVINDSEQASIEYMKAKLDCYLEVGRFNAYIEKQ